MIARLLTATPESLQVIPSMHTLGVVVVKIHSITITKADELIIVIECSIDHWTSERPVPPFSGRMCGSSGGAGIIGRVTDSIADSAKAGAEQSG